MAILLVGGCGVQIGGSGDGSCATATGSVNTYQFAAAWKKIQGYNPEKSSSELETDYDVFMFEPGSPSTMCILHVTNGCTTNCAITARGTYTSNGPKKTVHIHYFEGPTRPDDDGTYSFSGSCDATKMNMNYTDGTHELYLLRSLNVAAGACGSSSN